MKPTQVVIELTNACNANCIMCLRRHMTRPVSHISLDLIEKIISESKSKGYVTEEFPIGLCGVGEPTMHPQVKEALSIIREVPFCFGSNCQSLTPELSDFLIESKFKVMNLSLDAFSPESHSKIKRGLNYETVIKNAHYFINKLKESEKFWKTVVIQFIPNKYNESEAVDFMLYWNNIIDGLEDVFVFIKPIFRWPTQSSDDQCWPSPKVMKVGGLKVVYAGEFESFNGFRNDCTLFDTYVQIMSDGSYTPCCMNSDDEYKIGNIKDQTIEEMFNSNRMNEYRKLLKEKRFSEIPYCANCWTA